MTLNYLKLAIRLLIRNPLFSLINVIGLSVGFAMFFTLWQHASYELRSDQFHKDHERIYRLYFDFYHYTGVDWAHYLCGTLPPVLTSIAKGKFTEIEGATRIFHQSNFDEIRWEGLQTDTAGWSELDTKITISFIALDGEKRSFIETKSAYADPNLFEFFALPLLSGQPEKVLSSSDAIVLSSSTARKYFGDQDPIGRVVTINDGESFTVTGVFRDLPKNSHLNVELVLSALRIQNAIENVDPFQRSAQNYFRIREDASVAELEDKLNVEQKKLWDFKAWAGATFTVFLQPLKEVPFRVFDNDVFVPKSKYIAQAFQAIAAMVLVMAWINYFNLKLSKQSARMKELAARKTAGADRIDFIKQFLVESLVINALAVMVALTVIQVLRYPLETLFQFYLPTWSEIPLPSLIPFAGMMVLGILVAGLHPAFYVWRMSPYRILGHRKLPGKTITFASVSTVLQFVSAIALMVWLFSVSNQINFVINDDWGLNRSNVIVADLPVAEDYSSAVGSFKTELLSVPGVDDVALSTVVAGDLLENGIGFNRTDTTSFWAVSKSDGGVDERYIPFYGLKIIAGRNFIKDNPADRRTVILSRGSARSVGFEPDEAIGKIVRVEKYPWRPFGTHAEIIGVVEDHRHNPLYLETGMANANRGTIFTYGDHLFPKNKPLKMSIRIDGKSTNDVINLIEEKYHRIFPGQIFHWYFLEDHMNVHYKGENMARNQILLFTGIAISIACLGLLGMISNKVAEKTKEIGIRKILGAKKAHIARVLLNTSINQVIIATMIGVPLAHYLTRQYLEKFSERVSLQWWHFTFPVAMLVLIMLFTITSVILKAARKNPVDSLRYE